MVRSCYMVILKETKLSRPIKLNPTTIALILQEATQKYQKLTDYWTKSCSVFALLSVYCNLCFLSPSSRAEFFHFLNTIMRGFWTSQVIIRTAYSFVFWFENSFPKLSQLDITACIKNCVYNNFNLRYY